MRSRDVTWSPLSDRAVLFAPTFSESLRIAGKRRSFICGDEEEDGGGPGLCEEEDEEEEERGCKKCQSLV